MLIIFMDSSASDAAEAEEWNLAPAVGVFHVGVCVGACVCKCVYLSVCTFPHGFLWCYRGNWMCDAHQKSPLALGKCFFNPSMPLWKAQPKVRLILSTGKHQMLPCSLHHSLRLSTPLQHQRKTPKHVMTVHMCGGVWSSPLTTTLLVNNNWWFSSDKCFWRIGGTDCSLMDMKLEVSVKWSMISEDVPTQ